MPYINPFKQYQSNHNTSPILCSNLESLLDLRKELDRSILEAFPIKSPNAILKVESSNQLLEAYSYIDKCSNKLDIATTFANVKFEGFTRNNEIIFSITPKERASPIIATCILSAANQFFNIFSLRKYAHFLMSEGIFELLEPIIKLMLCKFQDDIKQFRLLRTDAYYLRAITSNLYRNYDNNIILYVVLNTLHQINSDNSKQLIISNYILDSSQLFLYISTLQPEYIPNLGNLYFGVMISNNELAEGSVRIELHYRFSTSNNQYSFGCLPSLDDPYIVFDHKTSIPKAVEKLTSLKNLIFEKNIMHDYIQELSNITIFTEEIAYSLLKKINQSKNTSISPKFKSTITQWKSDIFVKNTYSLIEGLNIISNLSESIDDKIALERIYYKLILELVHKKKNTQFNT